ncbi:N-formylglutamate amidohydrolase [Engelhardtia mirabilis]|uniref:N-formylglutamate amidohydrolase n=1 Tax=Engelhardtia mirabilis TaxID=2528011 RepID=A0A518BMI7_9BACT|nr:N-formylglutamate amidohydrolase [Planctomycetes bacterium Pla133]QDV02482.1 N-formylglutamate amidohydrolase [Planctomycetes bacterium Pla86]
MSPELVLSCEHGGNRVPARYRNVLRGAEAALASHRGLDQGAAQLARQAARALGAPLVLSTTTRLLVDANRSHDNPGCFSEWTRGLPAAERERLLERYWRPHRLAVEQAVVAKGRRRVLHLSVHSFTPVWKGVQRDVDVGLLYDPARRLERAFVDAWLAELAASRPDLRLRRNRPYRGTSDGLTTALRQRFAPARYLGVELEVSQQLTLGPAAPWARLRRELVRSLGRALAR